MLAFTWCEVQRGRVEISFEAARVFVVDGVARRNGRLRAMTLFVRPRNGAGERLRVSCDLARRIAEGDCVLAAPRLRSGELHGWTVLRRVPCVGPAFSAPGGS